MRRLLLLLTVACVACAGEEPRFHSTETAAASAESLSDPFTPLDPTLLPELEVPPMLTPPEPVGDIVFLPSDMSTATYQTVPVIAVRQRGMTPGQVAALAAQFELVTWPERQHVDTRTQYLDEGIVTAEFSRIALRPLHSLSSRWYAIRGVVPPGQAPPSPKDSPLDFDGKFVSRFYVASQPGVQRVIAAARVDQVGGDIEIFYSERVRDHAVHGHIRVDVDGRHDTSCHVGNRTELSSDIGARVVWLACDRIAPGSHLTIVHFQPMSSATGSGVVTAPDGSELGAIEMDVPSAAAASARPSGTSGAAMPPAETYVPSFGLGSLGI